MIGNDIVDLDLARKASNWKRKGYLDKIFSPSEQILIHNDSNPDLMVWNLWSRKEAAYKIYNRQTGISGFFPLRIECHWDNVNLGTVTIDRFVFYTQTEIEEDFVYSIAVTEKVLFDEIQSLETTEKILKEKGLPYIFDAVSKKICAASITHHGRFQRIVMLR
jgi:phosphopantetheinyl transferase (holo-ACP synthase)